MARQHAEARREEILRAATEVVQERGFARTRVADVADRLGISTALVFYHFETKERLLSQAFVAAAEQDLSRLEQAAAGPGPVSGRLRAVLRLSAPSSEANGWSLGIDAWAEALRSPEIQAASRSVDRRLRKVIERLLAEGMESGEFRRTDPRAAAERIAAMLDGLAVASQVRRTVSRARAARWAIEHAAAEAGISADALAAGGPAGPEPVTAATAGAARRRPARAGPARKR